MNTTLTIARRELAEKRFVFTAAAALAVLVMLMPFVPGVPKGSGRDVLVVSSAILSSAFAIGLAAILGTTIVGRELSERRLSFYFSKPIAAPAIWVGKVIAAAILLTITFLIVSAPAFFAGQPAIRRVWSGEGRNFFVYLTIIVTVAFFMGHILGTIARSRSAWAAMDLIAVASLALVAWLIARPLVDGHAFLMLILILKITAWLLLIAVLIAGVWQLSVGRTDRQRSHLALSRFLWPATAVVVAIAGAIVAWVVSASPRDLVGDIHAYGPGRSEYALVGGEARNRLDYRPAFLMHLRTGEFERMGAGGPYFNVDFVEGGNKLLIMRPIDRKTGTTEVLVRDVAKGSREEKTGLTVGQWVGATATTSDARRIAYVQSDILGVYDAQTKSSLGSVRLPKGEFIREMWFATPDAVRIHTVSGGGSGNEVKDRAAIIYEYDLRARSFRKLGEHRQISNKFVMTAVSPDRSKLIIRDDKGGSIVADTRTVTPAFTIPGVRRLVPLTDGRFAGFEGSTLRVFSPSGAPQRAIEFPAVRVSDVGWFAREIAPGKMLAGGKDAGPGAQGWRIILVDINTGAIVRSETGLNPLMITYWPGAPLNPEQLFRNAKGEVLRWNPLTNEKNVVIPAS